VPKVSILHSRPPSPLSRCCIFQTISPFHLHTSGCKQAYDSVEDAHPFTCVALIVISPTPRVVQWKQTALMLAIEKQNDAMVTALLDHNANVDMQDQVRQRVHSEDMRDGERMDM